MSASKLLRWGGLIPALVIGALMVILAVGLTVSAQATIAARPNPSTADDPLMNFDMALMQMLAAGICAVGVLSLAAAGLTRAHNRIVSTIGVVLCFLLAGAIVAYFLFALVNGAAGWWLAGILLPISLALAGGTGIAARLSTEAEERPADGE